MNPDHGMRPARLLAALAGVLAAALLGLLAASTAQALTMTAATVDPGANARTPDPARAGAHPDLRVEMTFESTGDLMMDLLNENVNDVRVRLPRGVVNDPLAVTPCRRAASRLAECTNASKVGDGTVRMPFQNAPVDIYSVQPTATEPARLAILANGNQNFGQITVKVTPEGDYAIDTLSPSTTNLLGPVSEIKLRFFGVPADVTGVGTPRPFVTNPTRCDETPTALVEVDSFEKQGEWARAELPWPTPTGCADVPFEGTFKATPKNHAAGQPAGYDFELALPQRLGADQIASSTLKDVRVELPEGLQVNPASAGGLAACTDAQFAKRSARAVACPEQAKLGTVTVDTPLLANPLPGDVFLGSQTPGNLIRLFLAIEGSGVMIKLEGLVALDPSSGRLTVTFDDNPEMPFSRLRLSLKGGQRAALINPQRAGTYPVQATLDSWSGRRVTSTSTIQIVGDGTRTAFAPAFVGGAANPIAGARSPFSLVVGRGDGDQELATLQNVVLPSGLLAATRGVPLCDAAAADAGTCPEASRVGRVEVAAGVGAEPVWLPEAGRPAGGVFLSGPYRGAPYSLSVVVPAQAGPFDLGRVVVRNPLQVDRRSAVVSTGVAVSHVYDRYGSRSTLQGAFPTMLDGIPLNVREIRILVDRDGFTVNPTDCSPMVVDAEIGSAAGARVARSSRFQVADCAALAFTPRLGLTLKGKRQKTTGKHPGLRARLRQAAGQAGIGRAKVTLPKALALDPDNAQALCEFDAGTKPDLESHCPKGSIVGRARAKTPLLERDLVGNVYFVKNVRKDAKTGNEIRTLPMIVVALRGEIAINLKGEASTTKAGSLVSTFANVPDAPISAFNLNIKGGNNGILAVTRTRKAKINLCAKPNSHRARVAINGHNGKNANFATKVKTPCAKKKAGKKKTKK